MRIARLGTALAAVGMLSACMIFIRPPKDAGAYEQTQVSASQLYRATYSPAESIRVGRLHTWNLRLQSADGSPVQEAQITVDGGMPQHGHGLPTKPAVTRHMGDGYHMVEGMKFNMGGWWVVKFHVAGPRGSDVITFNLKL